jgi:uracil-DNA glycosylase
MTKITKGETPKPADQNEIHQPVVGEAGSRVADLMELAMSFAPAVELRAVDDLKVNPRNARKHHPRQEQPCICTPAAYNRALPSEGRGREFESRRVRH